MSCRRTAVYAPSQYLPDWYAYDSYTLVLDHTPHPNRSKHSASGVLTFQYRSIERAASASDAHAEGAESISTRTEFVQQLTGYYASISYSEMICVSPQSASHTVYVLHRCVSE
jgi:hypothetical protein